MNFTEKISKVDVELAEAIEKEVARQRGNIELIASENFVSEAVLEAVGSPLTNKYAEGYPGKRYYGGCECVDIAEDLARERVIATYDDATTQGTVETIEAKNVKIDRSTEKLITIGIKAAATGETEYSKFKLKIDQNTITENETMEFTISTTDESLTLGTHTVMVCAYDETIDQWFSHIFAITITN